MSFVPAVALRCCDAKPQNVYSLVLSELYCYVNCTDIHHTQWHSCIIAHRSRSNTSLGTGLALVLVIVTHDYHAVKSDRFLYTQNSLQCEQSSLCFMTSFSICMLGVTLFLGLAHSSLTV